jgi:hypothetical protein
MALTQAHWHPDAKSLIARRKAGPLCCAVVEDVCEPDAYGVVCCASADCNGRVIGALRLNFAATVRP